MQHHFVAAAVPGAKAPYQFRLQVKGDEYPVSALSAGAERRQVPWAYRPSTKNMLANCRRSSTHRAATGACSYRNSARLEEVVVPSVIEITFVGI